MIKLLCERVVLMLLMLISTTSVFSQVAQVDVGLVCSNVNITANPPESMQGVDVRSFCSDGYSTRFKFYLVQIRSGSTFTFQLTPQGGGDYDFISWKNPPLNDIHNITLQDINALPPGDRGNRNTAGQGTTIGLSLNTTNLCNGVAGDGLERWYDVVPGDIVLIGVDDWSSNNPYTITFGGNAQLDCYFGKTFYECIDEQTGLATFNLDSYIDEVRPPNDNSPYFFYETEEAAEANDETQRINSIISLPYSEDGKEIFVGFVQNNGNVDVVKFNLMALPPLNTASDVIYGCYAGTNPQTGAVLGTFNLNEIFPPEYAADALISRKVFRTRAQAEANGTTGLIAESAWTNHGAVAGTYYVRLEYDLGEETKCVKIIPVTLEIVRVVLAESTINVDVCFEEVVNLTQFQNQFVPEENNYTYTYYYGDVEITNPAEFTVTESAQITVKIGNGSCISEGVINLNMTEAPYIEFWSDFTMCDSDFDGNYEVNLVPIRDFLRDNTGDYVYTFYKTLEDAQNETNPIQGDVAIIAPGEKLFVRTNSEARCFSIGEVPLAVGETIAFTAPTNALEECVGPEGVTTFDLTMVLPTLALEDGVTYKYFPSREDAIANTNEITTPNAWQTALTEGTVFILLQQEGKCDALVPIQFTTIEAPSIDVSSNGVICEGEVYTLDLSGYENYSFAITGNYTEVSTKVYQFTEAGSYTITISTASGCQSTFELNLTVAPQPVFAPIANVEICDENLDGIYEINLEQVKALAAAQVNTAAFTYLVKAFATEADAIANTNELTGTTFEVDALPAKVWFRASANDESVCFAVTSLDVVPANAITFTPIAQVLETCEVPNASEVTFDLTSMAPLFNTSATITYFTSEEDAKNNTNAIQTPNAWTTPTTEGTIYVRFDQADLCSTISSFQYVVNPLPEITFETTAEICDTETYVLDLSAYTAYTIELTGTNVVALGNNKFELNTAGTYAIAVTSDKGCTSNFTFTLVVNALPEFTDVNSFGVCDSNVDGEYELNLDALSQVVLVNSNGITLTYFRTEADLLANRNEITGSEYLMRLPAQIWVKATTASGCFVHKSIELVQGDSIVVTPVTTPLEVCTDQNGVAEFDLTSVRSQFNVPAGYILSYYPTLTDLQNGTNEILNPTVWTTTTARGTIYVKFEAAGLCPGYSSFDYIANPLPAIEIEDKYYICEGDEYVLDLSNYTTNIQVIGAGVVNLGNNKFRLSQLGVYNVVVENEFGCTSEYAFELATFDPPAVREIIVGQNTITVNIVPNRDYIDVQYSLDGINFQSSNVLVVPQRGMSYTIYVKIANCIFEIQEVQVIDIPTFFSPNNDGYNDVWRIRPIQLNQSVDLKIFDRFGKILFEQSGSQDILWDGKVAGKPLPTTDYWFTIDIQGEGVVQAIKYTGSITLKNKE